ncbi:DUF1295 domain-containing protein [Maridesulfovibrio ferrireducens]|uniref:DUF1295 domain-containing protein n=1 Tax=Maridesulfovibrio ferrireducens TaxID=246191 RepID=UPI001A31C090|nr:DUF1295 domain-containing protein [Maridesulfovibrio ferrireducens]MBI9113202.1 DUF1295 domain-containing protein [Maridesulfovibrio ferrireducens]
MFDIILGSASLVLGYFTLLYIIALIKKDNSIVDIAWGMGFVLVGLYSLWLSPEMNWRLILVVGLISMWGLRLSTYILLRNKGKKEDFRYAKWRQDWGKYWVIRSFIQVFLIQAFFLLTIAYPILMLSQSTFVRFSCLDYLGLTIWLIGFYFQAVGDSQKSTFKNNPANKGKIMQSGLWKYTRHPNYFGESTMWWGIFIITLNIEHGLYAIFSPMIITFLLLFVSGIPLLEKKYDGNPEFQDYKESTIAFIPWFPKQNNRAQYH